MNLTDYFILGAIVVIVVFDVVVSFVKVPTISERVWCWTKKHPAIAFLAGVVAGHLFWRG